MWHERKQRTVHEGLITAIAFGGLFIILGAVALSTPDIWNRIGNFFGDFTSRSFPLGGGTIHFPVPAHPTDHAALFTAAVNFAIGIAILQIIILPLRLALKSPLKRIAETVGNLVFWVGAAAVGNVFLLALTATGWFQFWSALIILVGASLIVRGVVQFSRSFRRR